MSYQKLRRFWEENVRKNVKILSWIIGEVIVTIFTVIFYCIRAELDAITTSIVLVFGVAPYIRIQVYFIFKGEIRTLKSQLIEEHRLRVYERDIAEYRCVLAARDGKVPEAIIANRDWYEFNKILTPENHVKRATDIITENIPKMKKFKEHDEKPK